MSKVSERTRELEKILYKNRAADQLHKEALVERALFKINSKLAQKHIYPTRIQGKDNLLNK